MKTNLVAYTYYHHIDDSGKVFVDDIVFDSDTPIGEMVNAIRETTRGYRAGFELPLFYHNEVWRATILVVPASIEFNKHTGEPVDLKAFNDCMGIISTFTFMVKCEEIKLPSPMMVADLRKALRDLNKLIPAAKAVANYRFRLNYNDLPETGKVVEALNLEKAYIEERIKLEIGKQPTPVRFAVFRKRTAENGVETWTKKIVLTREASAAFRYDCHCNGNPTEVVNLYWRAMGYDGNYNTPTNKRTAPDYENVNGYAVFWQTGVIIPRHLATE